MYLEALVELDSSPGWRGRERRMQRYLEGTFDSISLVEGKKDDRLKDTI